MTSTNHLGYCVEVYDRRMGWLQESPIYPTMAEAEAELARTPPDGYERRAYEVVGDE